MRHRTAAACALTLAFAAAEPAAASRSLSMGLSDGVFLLRDAPTRQLWLDRADQGETSLVRLSVLWSELAPRKPARPSDPDDPAYGWDKLDAAVRDAHARGLDVMPVVASAPLWAEGRPRPKDAISGTWNPSAREFRRLAVALGRRYSGRWEDPLRPGRRLPRVRYWQAWNEPNLFVSLTPQFSKSGRQLSVGIYRRLLRNFVAGMSSADPRARIVAAGTSPFGHGRRNRTRLGRTAPLAFWRGVLCLNRSLRAIRGCSPVRFDVFAHQPYAVRPEQRAKHPDDAAIADFPRLIRVLRAAERRRTVRGPRRHAVWCTEIGWTTNPPEPGGIPPMQQAMFLGATARRLWTAGVSRMIWFQIRDGGPDSVAESGLHFHDGTPKPSWAAYNFPLDVRPEGGRLAIWGRAPDRGEVTIELLRDTTVVRRVQLTPQAGGIFARSPSRGLATHVRARQGPHTSITWPL